jgi:hypothetical protein
MELDAKDNTKQVVVDTKTQCVTHRVDLTPAQHGRANMFYNGELIGVSSEPLFASARWLLEHGKGYAKDTIETYRGSTMSMRAKVGLAAKLTVRETDAGEGPRFAKWKPSPFALLRQPLGAAA